MSLFNPASRRRVVSPKGAMEDFAEVVRQAGPNKWRIAVLSALATGGMFSVMWMEGAQGPPARPKVTYITSWPAHRSDAEIIASNQANQRRKEALAAEQAKREEAVRQMYKDLGRASGMDVEAIEAKAKADAADAAKAAQSR
jgi:hypothetical protein